MAMPVSHILVSVSTPWAAQHMLAPLTSLAKRLEAGVTVLHIMRRGGGNPAKQLEDGRQVLNMVCERLKAEQVPCQSQLLEPSEDIAGAILDVARDVGATLLFLGISGKSPFARTAGGDIPIQLIRRTTIPVLMLPPALDIKL